MKIKINKPFHTRLLAMAERLEKGTYVKDLADFRFEVLLELYEIALAYEYTDLVKKIEHELKVRKKSEYIVPLELFTTIDSSKIGVIFAGRIYRARTTADFGKILEVCYRYDPPSYSFMLGCALAIAFNNTEVIELFTKLIKAHVTLKDSMPHFLEVFNKPEIIKRLAELVHKFESDLERPVTESAAVEPIEEDIEKHDELNPVLFIDNKLKPDIRDSALDVVEELKKMLEEREVKLNVKDIIITGSNASYNYTKDSDIDLHVVADISDFEDPEGLYPIIYQAIKSAFNTKYEIAFYGIPVEVYIESNDTPLVSNGIYSVLNDTWVKEPEKVEIPDVDMPAIKKAVEPWEARYNKLIADIESGKIQDETEIDAFIDDLYAERAKGLKIGEYSDENLLFKEIRNKGYLDKLKELRDQVVSQRLTLESLKESSTFDLNRIRLEIQRCTGFEPLIQPGGLFEIYNVTENQKNTLLGILRSKDFIDYVSASATKYDYSTFRPGARAAHYYKITGKIRG